MNQYRHRQNQAEVFGGWSEGRVDGWVRRYSVGVSQQNDAYALEPALPAPAQLPPDDKLIAPFVRFELIEDRFEKSRNRNQIERPEFFALGLASTVQLGRAQYYLRQDKRWLFYAAASGDTLKNPDPSDALLLGGNNGLRGYPLRYQSGNRRALFTLEERLYTDLYWFRLLRVGGAAFFDAGRAWGGSNVNTVDPGWLGNLGFGLRLFSVRSVFSNVLHLDVAFPLHPPDGVKKVQFLVKTKASF